MTTPLTWQLEGQDNSLGSTLAASSAAGQRWATEMVGYANQVFTAMKEAAGGGTTGAGGLEAIPAQAAAATTATKAYVQVQGEAAQQAALRGSAEEHAYAALMAAQQQADREAQAQMTRARAANAELLKEVEQLATAKKEEAAADEMRATQAARAAAAQSGDTRIGGFISGQDPAVDADRVAQAATTEATAQDKAAAATKNAGNAAQEAAPKLENAGNKSQELGQKADTAGEGVSRMGAHLQNLLFNQAFYLGLTAVTDGLHAISDLLLVRPEEQEDALVVYTRELGNAAEAQQEFNAVQKQSVEFGIKDTDWQHLNERLAELGVTAETAQARFGKSLAQIQQNLADLSLAPGMDVTTVESLFSRGADGAQRLVSALLTAGLTTRAQLQQMGVEFQGFTNTVISAPDVTARALLSIGDQFSGLALAHGQTMSGMKVAFQDTLDNIGRIAGKPVFTLFEQDLRTLNTELNDPKNQAGWTTLGERLADIAGAAQKAAGFIGSVATQAVTLATTGSTTGQTGTKDAIKAQFGVDVSSVQEIGTAIGDLAAQISGDTEAVKEHNLEMGVFNAYTEEAAAKARGNTALQAIAHANLLQNVAELKALQTQTAATAETQSTLATAQENVAAAALAEATAEAATRKALSDLSNEAALTALAISDLKAEEAGLTDPLQAQIASVSQYETTVLAQYQATTAGLNQSLSDVRDAATQASADAQTAAAPWQAKLADLATASQDLKAHYDSLIQPIKDQETALDRVYQRTQDIARINSSGDKVARDRALTVDIYSSEGRSAATRLPDEIAAQAQAQAEAAHNASKNVLEDRVTGLQREQAAQEANVQAQQRNDQAHITAIQNADKVTQAGYKAQEASIQTQIRDTDQQRAAFQKTQDKIKEDLQLQLDNITAMYNVRLKQYDTEAALIQRNQTLLQLGNAAVMATTLATSDVVLNTIITTVNALHNTALGLIPNLQNPNAGAVPGYTGKPYQNPNAGAIPGRASGGAVDSGWYTVGEHGPEMLHAGGSGYVSANGGGQTITLILEDPRDKKQYFRTSWQANRSYIKQDLTSMMRGN